MKLVVLGFVCDALLLPSQCDLKVMHWPLKECNGVLHCPSCGRCTMVLRAVHHKRIVQQKSC